MMRGIYKDIMTDDDEAAYGNLKQVTPVSPIPHIPKLSYIFGRVLTDFVPWKSVLPFFF
jgi:hypothetical protein